MRRVVIRATLAAFLLPWSASAQTLSLSELEALARLSPESPRVRAIRASIDVARADVLAAQRWPNPRLTVDRESVAGVTEYLTMVDRDDLYVGFDVPRVRTLEEVATVVTA